MRSIVFSFLILWLAWCIAVLAMTFSAMDLTGIDLNSQRPSPCAYPFLGIMTFGKCWDDNFPEARFYVQLIFYFLILLAIMLLFISVLRTKEIRAGYSQFSATKKLLLWELFFLNALLSFGISSSYISLKLLDCMP